MGATIYIMAILGCGEATDACQPVATMPVSYQNEAECNAATTAAIENHLNALFPVIVAECRPGGTPVAKIWADEVKLPAPDSSRQPRIQRANYEPRPARS